MAVSAATGIALLATGCGAAGYRPAAVSSPPPVAPTPPSPSATPSPHPVPVAPLTGLPETDPAARTRPALSVKVDNVAGSFPQAGLDHADLVADVLVEGGLTRLLAVFQSQSAPLVGPIRSARPVDADLVRLWNGGIFAYSGAAAGEIAPMIDHGHALRISFDDDPAPFTRLAGRRAPHNVFASTASLYGAAGTAGARLGPPPAVFTYAAAAPGGRPVHAVALQFSPFASAGWTWAGTQWVRTQDGAPDVLSDGARIAATNVVVMSAAVAHTGIVDAAGNEDPLDVVTGSGAAWVLRDGRVIGARWVRPDDAAPLQLLDSSGHVVPLKPGTTWLEVLPLPHAPTFN